MLTRFSPRLSFLLAAGLLSAASLPLTGRAAAQTSDAAASAGDMARAERAAASGDAAEALARYLRVLGKTPNNVEALIGAGNAALAMEDPNAALNFFARAEEISPRNGRVKAGLGATMVHLVQPRAALKLFSEAINYGIAPIDIAADRGLAYDLRGDHRRARADYDLVLATRPDPEIIRRLALSWAMAGEPLEALATLDPLLRQQDRSAWRDRAFVLAITGDVRGAEETARAVLPRPQAEALSPFLARLGTLKPSQQAAAVHFGRFPVAGETETTPRRSRFPALDALRRSTTDASGARSTRDANAAAAAAAAAADTSRQQPVQPPVTPRNSGASTRGTTPPTGQQNAAKEAIAKAVADRKASQAPAKTLAKAPAKPAAAREAERHWVQVATGPYKPDLGKEWTKLKAKYPALLGRQKPWTTPLNRTNRLLVGPFATAAEAQAFVNKAAGAGFSTSRFTSAPGQAVDALD